MKNKKKFLREINFFYFLAFLGTGVLFGLSLLLCRVLKAGFYETALISTMAAQFAPTLAAVLACKRFKSPLRVSFRVRFHYSILLCILVPLLGISIQYFYLNVHGPAAIRSAFFASPTLSLLAISTTIAGSVGEEIGWRAYLHGRLRSQMKPWLSSALTGLLWGIWHFTKIFNLGFSHYLLFTLSVIPLSMLMCYLNENAKGSLLPSIILHSIYNLTFMYFLFERETMTGYLLSIVSFSLLLLGIRLIDPKFFAMLRQEKDTLEG